MFGLGAGEILIILVVVLLFVGPDKLPAAARTIGKGIRDLRKQTKGITDTIEKDTEIGDAMRELRSALRGDPEPYRPPATTNSAGSSEEPMPSAQGEIDASEPIDPPTISEDDVKTVADNQALDPDLEAMIRPPSGAIARGDEIAESIDTAEAETVDTSVARRRSES